MKIHLKKFKLNFLKNNFSSPISETTTALVNLLIQLECTDPHPLCQSNIGGTTTGTLRHPFEKVPSSVI